MIATRAPALDSREKKWSRYLGDLQDYAAVPAAGLRKLPRIEPLPICWACAASPG